MCDGPIWGDCLEAVPCGHQFFLSDVGGLKSLDDE